MNELDELGQFSEEYYDTVISISEELALNIIEIKNFFFPTN